ncbi:MAG: hypothetical protein LRZ84_03755 [Desertifilum sp.]|nr:hypothetical protein [Desertifilum sp.]
MGISIFSKYKYALAYIGVDFSEENVQEALLNCMDGFEKALRATIAYWYWLKQHSEPFYPNACIIKAISDGWDDRYWKDSYLENPNFRNPCDIFWEEAGKVWGIEFRNRSISNIGSDDNGIDYITFFNQKKLPLLSARRIGWERLKEYVQ